MKKIKEKSLIITLVSVCLVMLVAMCVILAVTAEPPKQPFVPPEFDAAAVTGTPQVPDGMGYSEIYRQGMSFKASVCGEVRIRDGVASVYLTSPEENTLWLKLRILDSDGNILGETGLIKPGQYVEKITFTKLPKNGEGITLRLMSYQPDTYYSGGSVNLTTVATLEG